MNNLRAAYLMNENSASTGETKSSQINALIALVAGIKTGKTTIEELLNELENLKFTIDTMKNASINLRPVQPGIEEAGDKYDKLVELFDLLIGEFDNMALYAEEKDDKYLDEPIENIKKYTDEIMTISEEFRKVEEAQPVYSESVFLNDLIRVGKGYAEGKYELEPLINRYNVFREIMLETKAEMDLYINLPKDTKAFEENFPKVMECMDSSIAALDSMEAFFESGGDDRKIILPWLDTLQKDSEVMNAIQLKIKENIELIAEESSMRTCPRCSKKTSNTDKHCTHCNTVLPPLPEGYVVPQSEISVVEGAVGRQEGAPQVAPPGQKLVSPNILKIYESALRMGKGEITKEEFSAVINWYENIVNKTRKELDSVTEYENESEEALMVFREIFKLLKSGIEGSQAGLDELKLYFEDESLEHLVNGVNMLMDAGDQLYLAQIGDVIPQKSE